MIDLHTHSTFSDGSCTPEQLAHKAEQIGLTALSLTDHDSIDGVPRFMAACGGSSVRGVPGVEISVDFPGPAKATMHILGYFIDIENQDLCAHINGLRAGRARRNEEIVKRMNNMGMALTMAEVSAYAGEQNVGRLHFAQALVARGYVRTTQEAFDRYLAKGKSGYAGRLRLKPEDGIAMIRRADGIAALAHPFTLNLGKQALENCVQELTRAGLQGLEVLYPQHTPKLVRQYLGLAAKFKLTVTGGTDFHGTPMPHIQLGCGSGELAVPDSVLSELDALRAR